VPLQTRNVPARAEVQDPTVRMLLSSGSAPIPILQSVPVRTPGEGVDKTASGRYGGGYGAESAGTKGTWDESATPQSGSPSTTLGQAAIDAIRIGVATAGGGGRESTGGESSGGEQGNHLQ
jgi:hypothetical protein